MAALPRFIFACCILSFVASYSSAQDKNFHIYLAFGQSNMEGVADIAKQDTNTNPRFQAIESYDCEKNLGRKYGVWYTATPPMFGCWGKLSLADSFGREMIKRLPKHIRIGIVPTAVGGADIAVFQKGAPVGVGKYGKEKIPPQFPGGYAWLVDLAKKAQQKGVIKGILLHQGETNNGQLDWKNKVSGIVENLKKDLNLGDIPLLAGETLHGGCCDLHNQQIAQLPTIMNAYVISAQDLAGADEAHFTADSYRKLGVRYAEKMLEINYEKLVKPKH